MNRLLESRWTVLGAAAALCVVAACGKSAPQSPLSPSSASSASVPAAGGATVSGLVTASGGGSVRVSSVSGGLTVTVVGTNLTASVDGAGRFTLQGVPAGNVELQFGGAGVSARVVVGPVAERERLELEIEIHGAGGDVMTAEHVTPDDNAEVEGRISSIDNSARMLQVGGSSVQVPAGATIASGANRLDFKDLREQQRVHVRGVLQGTIVTAREVEIEDAVSPAPQPQPAPDPGDRNEAEFTGAIAGMGGGCPALSMTVAGRSVKTNGATSFLKAACGALHSGMTVEVKGAVQADGSVLASQVQAEDEAGAPAPQPEPEAELRGAVASLGGTCPAIALGVAGRSVRTSAATEFQGGSCGDVRTGLTVEITGQAASDGSVAASRVKIDR